MVASAFGIAGRRQDLKPSVKVSWGDRNFRTVIKSDAPGMDIENPSFDQTFSFPITAGMVPGPPVRIALLDKEAETGAIEVSIEEVLAAANFAVEKKFDVGNGAQILAGVVSSHPILEDDMAIHLMNIRLRNSVCSERRRDVKRHSRGYH
ncbi:unnamed protein product [Parascedosporium putredinis]|uniref:C2 domain-containing protein n=1 Tax=Parascedosporium putredinis TaxID=1442378 RepID=A0A9P1HD80_9PEZI|nr:unnamed protein product [Parascedosporium putredinis]CAI8005177.1 unnamed protein product [Parascedosporium putredinis]